MMADRQSYPSPNAAATRAGAGPFYANGGVSPTTEVPHLQLHDDVNVHINPDLQNSGGPDSNVMSAHQQHQQHQQHQALAQSVMSLAQQPAAFQVSPQPPPNASQGSPVTVGGKLRSKVSRACDECRRKKIRCDATAENETSSCTACKKSNQICQFSRTPQKRGPSKGYIKELADRVSSLEGQLRLGGEGSPPPTGDAGMSHEDSSFLVQPGGQYSPPPTSSGVKRTHSISEGLNDHYQASERTGFPPQHELQLDEGLVSLYYQYIHQTLPFLPSDMADLRNLLAETPSATSHAFLSSMEATMRSAQYSGVGDGSGHASSKHAYGLLSSAYWTDAVSENRHGHIENVSLTGLAQIQALLFLLIEANNRGGTVIRGGAGKSPAEYLGQAITKSNQINLFDAAMSSHGPQSDNKLAVARSIVLTISILNSLTILGDKGFGNSTSTFQNVLGFAPDRDIVGMRTYALTRIARQLSGLQTMTIVSEPRDMAMNGTGSSAVIEINASDSNYLRAMKKVKLDALHEIVSSDSLSADPVAFMAFWYAQAQIELFFYPIATAKDMVFPLKRLVELLSQSSMINPLTHHFAGFAAHNLLQLADFVDTKDQALQLLDTLDNTLSQLVPHSDTSSFDAAIRDAVARKRAVLLGNSATSPTMGLEHLANAAVSTTSTSGGNAAGGGGASASASTGAGAVAGAGAGRDEPAADGGVAAAAEAAAKAAQMHMGAQTFDGGMMSREGYLAALLA